MRLIDADALRDAVTADNSAVVVTHPYDEVVEWVGVSHIMLDLIDDAPSVCCGECAKWAEPSPVSSDLRRCRDIGCYLTDDCGCSFFERREP